MLAQALGLCHRKGWDSCRAHQGVSHKDMGERRAEESVGEGASEDVEGKELGVLGGGEVKRSKDPQGQDFTSRF